MLCYAMLCYAMLCYAMLCYAMLCYAMLCYAMLCYAMLCYAMLHYTILYYTILYYTILYYTIPYNTLLHYTTVRALHKKFPCRGAKALNFLTMKHTCVVHLGQSEPLSFLTNPFVEFELAPSCQQVFGVGARPLC